jgi:hypothetical protein
MASPIRASIGPSAGIATTWSPKAIASRMNGSKRKSIDQLTQHGDIDATETMVKVTSGVVTLAGTVEDRNSGSGNGSNNQSESQMTPSSSSSKR